MVLAPAQAGRDDNYDVTGYACTFNEPYVLYEFSDGEKIFERVSAGAFNIAHINDVVMLINHDGLPVARQSNGSLKISVDQHGLLIDADLKGSAAARELYHNIAAGLVTKMSYAFRAGEESYDKATHTRTIMRVDKLFDVSAVTYPANPDTEIIAKRYRQRPEDSAARRLRLKLKLMEELK